MKLKYALKFRDNKPLINWLAVINDIRNRLKANPEQRVFIMEISILREPKTFSQLAYFHAEILTKILNGYRDAGYDIPFNKEMALEWVKYQVKTLPEIMFVEEKTNEITGKVLIVPRSFADASKEEMSDIIDKCIRIYGEYFGIVFETPEEWKKRKGLK